MRKLRIALAGNMNVGKSCLFNYLTGLHQHIGNWPGKTIEKAEGTFQFENYSIDVIDLPGIYSLSTFSLEEIISRDYIVNEKPDLVINVVDSCVLERNLYFTLQLLELEVPMVIALNQIDLAKKKGIKINHKKLEKLLGIPVIPTVAPKGIGVYELIKKGIKVVERRKRVKRLKVRYGKEVEKVIKKLVKKLRKIKTNYPRRYLAVKLLEGDEEIRKIVGNIDKKIVDFADRCCKEIEKIHGHSCQTILASERYQIANLLAKEVQKILPPNYIPLREKIHNITTHPILGYLIMGMILLSIFSIVFKLGDFISEILMEHLEFLTSLTKEMENKLVRGIVDGLVDGTIAGITIVLPYILPFYLILFLLEDSGYLTRIAFLMDGLMHKIGLHGKAFLPLILGYGCNVPACLGCRIMESYRERFITIFLVTLIPCAATTVVILGVVGKFVSLGWALSLYVFNLFVVFLLGRIAFKTLPGEPVGLIMEIHDYRFPSLKVVIKQTWFRLREYIKIAFPLIVVVSIFIKILEVVNLLQPISSLMSLLTVKWLGLPEETGIPLLFGILRKELTITMLAASVGTERFNEVLSPVQMIVFTLVIIFYIPCVATIATLVKEIGWKKALIITFLEIGLAFLIGGVAYRILFFLG